ncbi:hypothetical protein [Roseisolibacter agri]|uniref:Outer membrane protein beta-barrel domain-containing protein n=1 Tax=Roseisolibacter agri TaxID=2014610 RepID=A0AA37V4W1_9BACT|nr:hypothetical protein [Roseisolibacter agri]GLC28422.1 hypothetical protein rosag_49350 [Roseisolibacter agri]
MTMHRSWAGALVTRMLVTLALVPAAALAQAPATADVPRVTLVLSAGGGSAFAAPSIHDDHAAVLGLVGARRQLWRAVMLEGALQLQTSFVRGSDLLLVCVPVSPGSDRCRARSLGPRALAADAFVSGLARVGVERRLGTGGPFVRLATGGGYMTEVRQPFATLAGGLAYGGRRARVALELDRWWSRVDVAEATISMRNPEDRSTRTLHEGATSTFVRLGLDIPVGAR